MSGMTWHATLHPIAKPSPVSQAEHALHTCGAVSKAAGPSQPSFLLLPAAAVPAAAVIGGMAGHSAGAMVACKSSDSTMANAEQPLLQSPLKRA